MHSKIIVGLLCLALVSCGTDNGRSADTIIINYNDTTVMTEGSIKGVSVSATAGVVSVSSTASGVNYVLRGQTKNGSLVIESAKKMTLTLDGINLRSVGSPAVKIMSAQGVVLNVAKETGANIADGVRPAEVAKGEKKTFSAIYSTGDVELVGGGDLTLQGNVRYALASRGSISFDGSGSFSAVSDSADAVYARNNVIINSGSLVAMSGGVASKALRAKSNIMISGGNVSLKATGAPQAKKKDAEDYKCSSAMCADNGIVISGGDIKLFAEADGAKCIKTDGDIIMTAGNLQAESLGTSENGSAKGLKADGNVNVEGGKIAVVSHSSEGIESKKVMTISGGQLVVEAYDDAINSGNNLNVLGSVIFARSVTNDALDSNGNLNISDGKIFAIGSQLPECGLDANEEEGFRLYITGGEVWALGGNSSLPARTTNSQPVLIIDKMQQSDVSVADSVAMQIGRFVLSDMPEWQLPAEEHQDFFTGEMPTYTYLYSSGKLQDGATYSVSIADMETVSKTAQIAPEPDLLHMMPPPGMWTEGDSMHMRPPHPMIPNPNFEGKKGKKSKNGMIPPPQFGGQAQQPMAVQQQ